MQYKIKGKIIGDSGSYLNYEDIIIASSIEEAYEKLHKMLNGLFYMIILKEV